MTVVIHCDECAKRFEIARPEGRIEYNKQDGIYHFVPSDSNSPHWNSGYTECGMSTDTLDSMIGVHGMELSVDNLTNHNLAGLRACPRCFANVW